MLFPFFQFSANSLFIGIPAETSNLMTVSDIFQPECRWTARSGKTERLQEKKNIWLIWKQVMLWSGTSNVADDYIACSHPQQAM